MRSYLIHRLAPLGADPESIIKRIDEQSDISTRRALILSLGEYGEGVLTPKMRSALYSKIQEIYQTDADPGLHGAAEWL